MEDKKMEQWIYQMAEKEVWKVPKSCEEKVERILETLSEASEKEETMRYLKKKRTFLLVAALVAVTHFGNYGGGSRDFSVERASC